MPGHLMRVGLALLAAALQVAIGLPAAPAVAWDIGLRAAPPAAWLLGACPHRGAAVAAIIGLPAAPAVVGDIGLRAAPPAVIGPQVALPAAGSNTEDIRPGLWARYNIGR
jgi:hypothetical protein